MIGKSLNPSEDKKISCVKLSSMKRMMMKLGESKTASSMDKQADPKIPNRDVNNTNNEHGKKQAPAIVTPVRRSLSTEEEIYFLYRMTPYS